MERTDLANQPESELKKEYEILEKVSEGQFGTVFRATKLETGQIVAIKKLYVSAKHSVQLSKNVLREIECMKKIKSPYVIQLLDHKIKESSIKLVMDFMDYDLKNFIEFMPNPIKNSKLKGIAKMILQGLDAIHSNGVLHRDLKPSNILVNSAGLVKIGDFGSATPIDNTQNGLFEIEGFSRWYKAPEILYGSRSYDQRVDIWSFACIFGELLNGAPLFPGNNDFDQLSRIMSVLGTPTSENWKDLESLPDYSKVVFHEQKPTNFETLFPNATKSELSFIKSILCYERPKTIKEILAHSYFSDHPKDKRYQFLAIKKMDLDSRPSYQTLLKV